jgi:hypothetical protein
LFALKKEEKVSGTAGGLPGGVYRITISDAGGKNKAGPKDLPRK